MLPARIRRHELAPGRVAGALLRRVVDVPHRLAWEAPGGAAARNRERLARYADRHVGQRCFILGNGPSLATMELSALAGEVSFGLNRIYLLFEKLRFSPTYYCAANDLVLRQFAHEIRRLPMPRFLSFSQRRRFPEADDTLFLRLGLSLEDFFGTDPRRALCAGGTVTFVALQLAYFMGFQQVILVGVDHVFSEAGTPNRVERRNGEDRSHFDPAYFPRGSLWQLPDLHRSELAYGLARRAFEADGREVLDATRGGKLDVFPKVDFDDLVGR